MNGLVETLRGIFATLALVARATVTNVTGHWALAFFSLLAAGAIWIVIQDIENPRVEDLVPLESESQGIPVEFVNLSPDLVVADTPRVRVRVEARESDIPDLGPNDFVATVDLQGIEEAGNYPFMPVTVESLDDSVTVLSVEPARVNVEVDRVEEKEVPVEVNLTGQLPNGYEQSEPPEIDPAVVTVSGRAALVENVERVQVDVNLSGQRESFQTTGELVARNRNGDRQTVTLSSMRATVTFSIEQTFVEKELPVRARLTGNPEPGYRVSSIEVQPPTVTVRGARDIVDELTEVTLDPIDLGGATSSITQTRNIQPLARVELSRESVRVDVGIAPIVCEESDENAQCAGAVFTVAPDFEDMPAGLALSPGVYMAEVVVSGPLVELGRLSGDAISVTVSLAGLEEGSTMVEPTATVPSPFRVERVEPMTVTLVSGQAP